MVGRNRHRAGDVRRAVGAGAWRPLAQRSAPCGPVWRLSGAAGGSRAGRSSPIRGSWGADMGVTTCAGAWFGVLFGGN